MKKVQIQGLMVLAALLLLFGAGPAAAQEIRYSWLDMSFMGQDIDRSGVQVPLVGQSVEVAGSDGDGIRFRGSIGTWKNLYLFMNYASSDIDVDAVITNAQGVFFASDEFDFTIHERRAPPPALTLVGYRETCTASRSQPVTVVRLDEYAEGPEDRGMGFSAVAITGSCEPVIAIAQPLPRSPF